jgi:hypothetical protein
MTRYGSNGNGFTSEYESPFTDVAFAKEEEVEQESIPFQESRYMREVTSPFSQTFEPATVQASSPIAGEFVNFLGELHDSEFHEALYEMAAELQEIMNSKVSDEVALGDRLLPYAKQTADQYFVAFTRETDKLIDATINHFSGGSLADQSESEVERFFETMEFDHPQFSPAQENLFGGLFDKIKNVVKKGVDLAKKGISIVGKILPVDLILGRLKAFVRPLLEKVLRFAIGKLPQSLQPYAQTLSKKFLNMEVPGIVVPSGNEMPASTNLESVQTELDNHIAQLMFSENESKASDLVMNYEQSDANLQREEEYESVTAQVPSIGDARERFIRELKDLRDGESPQPAIERFLPAIIPIAKIALSVVGRDRVINFLAGLLTKLIGSFVPPEVSTPLARSIVDIGMHAIGLEVSEMSQPDLGHEAIANTIEQTVQKLTGVDETTWSNESQLAAEVLNAFEAAAAENFPSQYIKQELRRPGGAAVWVLKPRKKRKHLYKKYTRLFSITIDPATAKEVTSFRGLPLGNFLKDKLGLDVSKPIQAKVHLYESIAGTRLSDISSHEHVMQIGGKHPRAWVQLHPLTQQAASLLLKEPGIGKDVADEFTKKRTHIATGQRFYFLEISGARLRIPAVDHRNHRHQQAGGHVQTMPGQSADVQGIVNFVKSEIIINYYFSEEDAKSIVEKLNKNDYTGVAQSISQSVKNVLNGMLSQGVTDKVKIIHESFPELYLENYAEEAEEYFSFGDVVKTAGKLAMNAGKGLLTNIIQKLVEKISGSAYQEVLDYFKARANEFKQAQAEPQDGVTIQISWRNIPGMAAIGSIINAIKGNLSVGNLNDLSIPSLPKPAVTISSGKKFE